MTIPGGCGLTVCVVVPAHNEADHIARVILGMPDWVDRIIVVDDGSTDRTSAAVEGVSDDRLLLIRNEVNGGVGSAMRIGYRAALAEGFDLVAKMDADGQMLPDELGRLTQPFALGTADYTKGNRFYLAGRTSAMPPHRHFGNNALSFLTKIASGYWHVYDSQCGYTVVRAAFLRLLDLDRLPDDYFFENAMLIQLNGLNARVVDVPVTTVYGAERSGVDIARVVFSFPMRLAASGLRRFGRKHFVTDFGAIGILSLAGWLLLGFGAVFGAYRWWLSTTTDVAATTGTVMVAVLPVIVGIQLLLQAFGLSVSTSPGSAESASYVRALIADGSIR